MADVKIPCIMSMLWKTVGLLSVDDRVEQLQLDHMLNIKCKGTRMFTRVKGSGQTHFLYTSICHWNLSGKKQSKTIKKKLTTFYVGKSDIIRLNQP